MISIKPDFFGSFSCIADKCSDSCCIGWEIDVDEKALSKYRGINSDFGERLQGSISSDNTPHFILGGNERCPFLNGKNLCDIIINCGEEYLCDICREHPRFYEWYGNYKDCGLGLCCEEACRLLLSSDEPLKFIKETDETTDDNKIDSAVAQRIFEIREHIFNIISDRKALTLSQRITHCCDYINTLQKSFGCKSSCEIKDTVNEIFEIMKMSEPFDDSFPKFLNSFSFDKLRKSRDKAESKYERLFTYFVFRHFIKAIYDNDLITHFKVCILLLITELLYEESSKELSTLDAVKYISKQFEYSEENTDLLEFECADNRKLSFENLVSCLDYLL